MIIGDGDIASVLPDRPNILFFASGVSNSQETREEEFQREVNLLMAQDNYQHIVYFSSLSVFYANTLYTKHKLKMEARVKKRFVNWTIIRLGNITWGTNPHTIINHFRKQVKNNEPLEIQDTYRYVIDKEEFLHWIDLIPNWNCEMNLSGQRMTIKEIVNKYVYLGLHSEKI